MISTPTNPEHAPLGANREKTGVNWAIRCLGSEHALGRTGSSLFKARQNQLGTQEGIVNCPAEVGAAHLKSATTSAADSFETRLLEEYRDLSGAEEAALGAEDFIVRDRGMISGRETYAEKD